MLEIITIQKVFAEDRSIHSYLVGKCLNKQANLFFVKSNADNTREIVMLSARGHLFKFQIENGRYKSIPFEDLQLREEAIRIVEAAVNSGKYPFYDETLKQIKRSLNYTPASQGLF